jgi:hypothetical protein
MSDSPAHCTFSHRLSCSMLSPRSPQAFPRSHRLGCVPCLIANPTIWVLLAQHISDRFPALPTSVFCLDYGSSYLINLLGPLPLPDPILQPGVRDSTQSCLSALHCPWLLTALQALLPLTSVIGHCWPSCLPLIFLLYFNSWLVDNNSHYKLFNNVCVLVASLHHQTSVPLFIWPFYEICNLLNCWLVGLHFCCLFLSSRGSFHVIETLLCSYYIPASST